MPWLGVATAPHGLARLLCEAMQSRPGVLLEVCDPDCPLSIGSRRAPLSCIGRASQNQDFVLLEPHISLLHPRIAMSPAH
eukprot:9287180-Alexandrium_andersonii.AAC.1